jgi:NAD(P)-dependent dehydrogenase (short-subunit alcohol dehydrogenase family)
MGLLDGKVAIVTGAGHGIGRGHAMELAKQGAKVVVNDVGGSVSGEGSGRDADLTVKLIEERGGEAVSNYADVADYEAAGAMVQQAVDTYGQLDILVNNAGIVVNPAFPDAEPEAWLRVLDVNLRGPMLGTYHAIPAMRDRGGGAIVNIASLAGVGFGPHPAPDYAATKAGVARFTAALASLGETSAIRVNCICPDWVDTPMSRRSRSRMTPEEEAATVPPGILAPEEIADAAVELIRDDSLAGRVMACWCDQPRSLFPVPDWS